MGAERFASLDPFALVYAPQRGLVGVVFIALLISASMAQPPLLAPYFDVGIALQVQLVRITNRKTCKLSRATACIR
jgi:hypothetical protein